MPSILLEHIGLDATGSNGVAGDTSGSAVGSERATETFVGGFGGTVERMVGDGKAGGDGRHEDDTATLCIRV